ncbi:PKD domain-containing protein [bacterium]|nr:PKD domain-containing protein [bacterium]
MIIYTKKIKHVIYLYIFIFLILFSQPIIAQGVYISEELFTIPWGNQPGELSTWWNEEPPEDWEGIIKPPGPVAVSSTGGFVIVDYDNLTRRLTKYSIDGTFVSVIDLKIAGLPFPSELSVADSGEVLFSKYNKLVLLDTSLQPSSTTILPSNITNIWPSNNGGFWCKYSIKTGNNELSRYMVEFNLDGSVSESQLLFAGQSDDPNRLNHRFITPLGQSKPRLEDMYGYKYIVKWIYGQGNILTKRSPSEVIVYEHTLNDDPDWQGVNDYFITWEGDFYTIHATSDGVILTKYDLHVDPVCIFKPVTLPPYTGPSPVAIEFDASQSHDDDNDPLTFHWDFDGDGIFDEPVDDAYTGPPDNPTHEYTVDYEGPVILKVTDDFQGECELGFLIMVDVV